MLSWPERITIHREESFRPKRVFSATFEGKSAEYRDYAISRLMYMIGEWPADTRVSILLYPIPFMKNTLRVPDPWLIAAHEVEP